MRCAVAPVPTDILRAAIQRADHHDTFSNMFTLNPWARYRNDTYRTIEPRSSDPAIVLPARCWALVRPCPLGAATESPSQLTGPIRRTSPHNRLPCDQDASLAHGSIALLRRRARKRRGREQIFHWLRVAAAGKCMF